jgi:broad specificity phosphatase PhoE
VIRLYVFARHGESTANVRAVVDSDPCRNVELTDHGRRQALRLGQQLRHLPIDRAICSRFTRTQQTAEIALRERPLVGLEVEAAFDEVDAGTFGRCAGRRLLALASAPFRADTVPAR